MGSMTVRMMSTSWIVFGFLDDEDDELADETSLGRWGLELLNENAERDVMDKEDEGVIGLGDVSLGDDEREDDEEEDEEDEEEHEGDEEDWVEEDGDEVEKRKEEARGTIKEAVMDQRESMKGSSFKFWVLTHSSCERMLTEKLERMILLEGVKNLRRAGPGVDDEDDEQGEVSEATD